MDAIRRLFAGWSWAHWYNLAREDMDAAIDQVRRSARLAVLLLLLGWVASGWHIIRSNEVGLEFLCGRRLRALETPGLRYRLPWPMGAVRRVPLQTQQRVTVGVRPATAVQPAAAPKVSPALQAFAAKTSQPAVPDLGEGLPLITADRNVVLVQAVLQYVILDPARYVLGCEDSALALQRAATSGLLHCAASTGVDGLLTTSRTAVQQYVREMVQWQADRLGLGVRAVGVELQKVAPPLPVAEAFRGVNTAREERNTAVNEAKQYAGKVVPEAEGEGDRLTKAAQAYRETRLADANGQAARFGPLSAEFERNGAITAERLRAETIEQIMARAKKVQVAGGADLRLTAPTPGAPGAQP